MDTSKCKNCGKEIKQGELVKTTWNGELDEHINCTPNNLITRQPEFATSFTY